MKLLNKQLFDATSAQAKSSARLRMNHNFHEQLEDPINRMINAMEPGSYVRPHRHFQPPKEEIFLVLRGEIIFFLFDETGRITEKCLLNPLKGNYGAEIPAGTWHGLLVIEPDTILYEVKQGPFVPLVPTDFAPWSPAPEETEEVKRFMEKLLLHL